MYNEYQPSLLLAPYIDKYWEFKGNPDYGMKINILPDGCTDFIFTLGEVADIAEQESLIMQPYRSYFVGPMSRYSTLIPMRKASICLVSVFCLAVYSASCNYHWKNLGIKESALLSQEVSSTTR